MGSGGDTTMRVILHPIPGKYLEHLPNPGKGHIIAALEGLEKKPPEGDIRPITG
jgi:hypothetical protein